MSVLKPQEPNLGRDGREVDSPLKKTEDLLVQLGREGDDRTGTQTHTFLASPRGI